MAVGNLPLIVDFPSYTPPFIGDFPAVFDEIPLKIAMSPEPGYAEARGHTHLAQLLDDARHKAGDFDLSDVKNTAGVVGGTQISAWKCSGTVN